MYQYNTVLHNSVPYVVHNWLTVHDVVIMDMEPIFLRITEPISRTRVHLSPDFRFYIQVGN